MNRIRLKFLVREIGEIERSIFIYFESTNSLEYFLTKIKILERLLSPIFFPLSNSISEITSLVSFRHAYTFVNKIPIIARFEYSDLKKRSKKISLALYLTSQAVKRRNVSITLRKDKNPASERFLATFNTPWWQGILKDAIFISTSRRICDTYFSLLFASY